MTACFAMFTDEGNALVADLVGRLWDAADAGTPEDARLCILREGLRAVEAAGHEEVRDTMVRDHLADALADTFDYCPCCFGDILRDIEGAKRREPETHLAVTVPLPDADTVDTLADIIGPQAVAYGTPDGPALLLWGWAAALFLDAQEGEDVGSWPMDDHAAHIIIDLAGDFAGDGGAQ